MRRSLKPSTIANSSATTATAPAARATMPVVVVSSCIGRGAYRSHLRTEDGRERPLVVGRVLLARDRQHLDLDGDGTAGRRRRRERHVHGLGLARREGGD